MDRCGSGGDTAEEESEEWGTRPPGGVIGDRELPRRRPVRIAETEGSADSVQSVQAAQQPLRGGTLGGPGAEVGPVTMTETSRAPTENG